jgi:HEAT repeat protein
MKSLMRHWRWLLAVAVLLAVALSVPGSPLYLPAMLVSDRTYDGLPARHWMKALQSDDPEARGKAAFALGAIGAAAGESVPALAAALVEDADVNVRHQASLALSKMAPASRGAVAELAKARRDDDLLVRRNAAVALYRLGEEARPAVPALIRALGDETNDALLPTVLQSVHESVALALGRASAGTADGVPALLAALESHSSDRLPRAVAAALGDVGPEARAAVPKLVELLHDDEADIRLAAEEALKKVGGAKPAPTADPELPEGERKYLWEVENLGNHLNKDGFAALAKALAAEDAKALSRLLADDFAGADLRDPVAVRSSTEYAQVERLDDAGRPPAPLSRDGFVARLLSFRKPFGAGRPQVKLVMMTLGPADRGNLDGPWRGNAQLRLHGEHARGAPAEVVAVIGYEVPRPTPEALAKPGWLRAATVRSVFTAKAPRYLFADATKARGLDASRLHDNWHSVAFHASTGGAYVCDFDRDGALDVLLTDVTGSALYRGKPAGGFEDVTERVGLGKGGLTAAATAWIDIDGDGWDDLIVGLRVFRNVEGRAFEEYTGRARLGIPHDATNLVVADYDRDGRLDVYVARTGKLGRRSWLEGHCANAKGNLLLRNKGGWAFENVTRAAGAGGDRRSTFTAAWLDADGDGWPDLHVPNEFGDGVLLINTRDGKFRPQRLADRPADFGTMGLAVGDVDNDGRIDVYCANMYSKAGTRVIGNLKPDAFPPQTMEKFRRFVAGSQLHLNRGGMKFEQAGQKMRIAAVGWAYGTALADLDNDGFLDVYGTAGYVSRDRDEPDG